MALVELIIWHLLYILIDKSVVRNGKYDSDKKPQIRHYTGNQDLYLEDGLRKRDIRKAQRPDVKKRKRS